MTEKVPMILPKGIVVNTQNVYKEVASYSTLPTDKVWQYWRVYTTTNKKLLDPTACRLEHFWWHVWGSDRRFLNGRALAKLYEDISLGPTFAPLRGPPNRWEGPEDPPTLQEVIAMIENHDSTSGGAGIEPDVVKEDDHTPRERPQPRQRLSSSSKPPPPPILKKSRGPSSSGPRPTARFVSPHTSADETEKEADIPSSGSTITPDLEIRPPAKSTKKKSAATGKKFVASTAAGKRRPVLPRKMSSQSSVTSDTRSVEGASSIGSRTSGSLQRAVSPIPEITSKQENPSVKENTSVGSHDQPSLSAKAAGKRPAAMKRNATETNLASTQKIPTLLGENESPLPLASHRHIKSMPRAQSSINLPTQAQNLVESVAKAGYQMDRPLQTQQLVGSLPMAQSRSHSGYDLSRERRQSKGINHGLFGGATASTTNVAAQGTIIDQSGSVGAMPIPSFFQRSEDDNTALSSSSSLLESRLTPTLPSTSASVPLGRTKSQLTLLLEREKERKIR